MAATFEYKRDAVRIKALKYDGSCMPDTRKFSVDPQITTFEVLRSILGKAFDIKEEFTICYRVLDDYGQETYLPLLSDWDLDAAFVSAGEPCLCLRIEMKIIEEIGQEWEPTSNSFSWITDSKIPLRLQGLIMNHVEKTVSIVRGALNFIEEAQQAQEVSNLPPRPPLTDCEFRQFLDPVGQLIHTQEFKNTIYLGGVEPSLRKVVWKHLLNVYPDGLSGKQRIEYMKTKSYEYEQLRDTWRNLHSNEKVGDLAYVTNMVKKDVLRTDRHHRFYAGNDDNQNIASLFNILTTYALNHASISYCQGMSDLASPLLVTMGDEAHAYICFCALMRRLGPNFLMDGVAMTKRFQHLADGLLYYDASFYAYLKAHQADDLLFCYRWLLLEMKREFAFEDALRMMEVMWSSLPPTSMPAVDLPLYESKFGAQSNFPPPSPSPRETPYTKVCALRRQTSSGVFFKMNRSLDESTLAKRRFIDKLHSKVKQYSSLDEATLSSSNSKKTNINNNNRVPIYLNKLNPSSSSSSSSSCSSVNDNTSNNNSVSAASSDDNLSNRNTAHHCPNTTPNSTALQDDDHRTASKNTTSTSALSLTDINEEDNERLLLTRKGSLNLKSSSASATTSTTGKKVKNFNEFLSLDRKNILKNKLKLITSSINSDDKIGGNKQREEFINHRKVNKNGEEKNLSSPDDSEEYYPMTTSMTREFSRELENLDKRVFGEAVASPLLLTKTLNSSSVSECSEADVLNNNDNTNNTTNNQDRSNKIEDVFVWENPLQQYDLSSEESVITDSKCNGYIDSSDGRSKKPPNDNNSDGKDNKTMKSSSTTVEYKDRSDLSSLISQRNRTLPPPWEFGGGNPFLMYLCITVLYQHRDIIIKTGMDYNEIAMHFDKMVRKHNVIRVLNHARIMYGNYLKRYKQNYLNV